MGDDFMNIDIQWDEEALVWVATNEEIGIALEDASYDNLLVRLQKAIPEMCELNNIRGGCIFINTAVRKVICV